MARAPAGWYADVQHTETERWYDGRTWTDRRRPATGGVPTVDDGRTGRGTTGPRHPDRPATLWLRTVLGAAALAAAVAAVGLLAILVVH